MAAFALGLLLMLTALPALSNGLASHPVQVVYIYSRECTLCEHAGPVVRQAAADGGTQLSEHEFNSQDGMRYMRMYGLESVPAVIVNGDAIRFEDYEGDTGRLGLLLREKIAAAKSCPLVLERSVSRADGAITVTTSVANNGPEPVKAELSGGIYPGASVVSGDPSWNGVIQPGNRQYVTYRLRVDGDVRTLPPQTLSYQDSGGSHGLLGPETPLQVSKRLSVAASFVAGVVAGINPCLLAVMAFLSAMTLSSEHKGRTLAVRVCSFCAGLLFMYLLIGIGFLRLMHGMPSLADTMRLSIIFLLVGLAAWSFYDAYTVDRNPGKLSFFKSLAGRMKPLYSRFGLAASFLLGGAFGLIKMPCVGGMYIAILGAILDAGDMGAGLACMAAYNAGVVLPVLGLGLLLTLGLSPERINEFRHRHRVAMKAATGLLLIAMAAGLALNLL
jgi:cytochrome c biogenesis protein CcdA